MLNLIKYNARPGLSVRIGALISVAAVNLVFVGGMALGLFPKGGGFHILGIVLSAFALCAVFVACVIADAQTFRGLYSAPEGYNAFLAPVPAWKHVLSRLIPMTFLDGVTIGAGITGVVMMSVTFAESFIDSFLDIAEFQFEMSQFLDVTVWAALLFVLQYAFLLALVFFGITLAKTYLFKTPGGAGLAVVCTFIAASAMNWLYLPLAGLTPVLREGPGGLIITINLGIGFGADTLAAMAVMLIQTALLVAASAYVLERKANI